MNALPCSRCSRPPTFAADQSKVGRQNLAISTDPNRSREPER